MTRVLIRPPWNPWLRNEMFRAAEGCVYASAFLRWREIAGSRGVQLDTWDMCPIEEADCIWMMDLPPSRSIYVQAKRRVRQGVPFVLQTLESPLLTPLNFVEANRRAFDAVVSFERDCEDGQRRFGYRLPISLRPQPTYIEPSARRCAVMVNSNRVEGYLAVRQPGLTGLPGIGRLIGGWRPPLHAVLKPAGGELYSWRRRLARAAERGFEDTLDVYGRGWRGERLSWCPGYPNPPYRCADHRRFECAVGSENRDSKHSLLSHYRFGIATENYRGALGYVSEKITDVLQSGAVPVYLGDERISEIVPSGCFVDVRKFRSHEDLLGYLRDCPEGDWLAMYHSGRSFLGSEAIKPFTEDAFAENMMRVLERVLR